MSRSEPRVEAVNWLHPQWIQFMGLPQNENYAVLYVILVLKISNFYIIQSLNTS